MFTDMGMEFDFIDFRDVANIEKYIKPNTKLIFSESPSNPTLTLTDIAAVSAMAKSRGIPHVIDSTFATPIIQRPIELGADLVIQSTTKFYDGHNITVGGAVISATKELHETIKHMQNVHGNIMSPQNAFYTLQTAKTLGLRIRKQSANAQLVAEFLESHPMVDVVRYPGLASFPQKELADRQHIDGVHGAMLWFEVKGGTESGRQLMNSIQRPWSLCENLGAVESICTCPSVMTHANMLQEDRLKVGITDGFVRISCGIEDPNDLIESLRQSLDALRPWLFLAAVVLLALTACQADAKSAEASHILVPDEATCLDLKKQIDGGADFADLAAKHSTCPSGKSGGSLGSFGPGQMVPEFDKVIWDGELKKTLGPVKTQFGYHLIWITSRTD